ncbi:hypothetical protein, partial [Treponema endosymbiont of Eucomonympha sp.]|uniref:hypothetical protein n=1 Tax=Treponema endosymbiont of Eucomonympha sp. TaxID=1580831 RepID=UPI000B16E0C1
MEAKETRGESGFPRAFSEAPPEAEINDVTVSGAYGEPLSYIISVRVNVFFLLNPMHMDAAPWFVGFPAGVSATFTGMFKVDDWTAIEISLTGSPLEGIAGLIKLRIPGDYLSSGETLETDDNPNAVWDIEPRSARVDNAVVAGGVGNPLDYTITGQIYADHFDNAANVPCESWFLGGFPAGLTALANMTQVSPEFSIRITGTPSETFGGLIKLRLERRALVPRDIDVAHRCRRERLFYVYRRVGVFVYGNRFSAANRRGGDCRADNRVRFLRGRPADKNYRVARPVGDSVRRRRGQPRRQVREPR